MEGHEILLASPGSAGRRHPRTSAKLLKIVFPGCPSPIRGHCRPCPRSIGLGQPQELPAVRS